MFDRRLIHHFDWVLLTLTLLICITGIMTLHSAVTAEVGGGHGTYHIKQTIWYGMGFLVMIVCFSIDYKTIERWAYPIYTGELLLLLAVLFFGKLAGGSRRWLVMGPLTLQPSELAKISVIIILARYYSKRLKPEGFRLRELPGPLVLTLLPFLLIVKQPDLGTGLVVGLIAVSITLYVKIEKRSLMILAALGVVAGPLVWFILKDYQRQRILTFISPDRDPLGAGYHIIQSKIAIGSGMLTGKGFLKGTQNALSFLPERHTDFIFSVLSEEWGFIGASAVVLVFLFLIIWGLNIAYHCRDSFGRIMCVGCVSMIFWQAFINLGMVMGLMPVVGMPLPLISYGGSSVLTIMMGIGLLMNISMRRYVLD